VDHESSAQVAFITGASRGIGKAIAIRLAQLDYNLCLLARDKNSLDSVVTECERSNAAVMTVIGDVANIAFMNSAVDGALEKFGRVDVLINNAGKTSRAPVHSADLDEWRNVLDVNFTAVMHLTRQLLPQMIERKSGAVINLSSLSGRHTDAGAAIYAATKHALNGFSGCLYEDVRDYGIKVSTIMPGFVETELTAKIGKQSANMIQTSDIADAVAYVLAASPSCCPTEIVIRPQRRP
jgi:NADP-dependent 3-hydroxy acid dehydrogenase YdfG